MNPYAKYISSQLFEKALAAHAQHDDAELLGIAAELRRREGRGAKRALDELKAMGALQAPASPVQVIPARANPSWSASPSAPPQAPVQPWHLPAFVMPLLALPRPIELLRFARTAGLYGAVPPPSTLETARRLLAAARRGERPTTMSYGYGVVRALVYLLDETTEHQPRLLIARLVLGDERARVRELFALWQDVHEARERAATRLAPILCGPHDGPPMPAWLETRDRERCLAELHTPARAFTPWLDTRRPRIEELDDVLGVVPSSAVATELVDAAIATASEVVWRAFGRPEQVRTWALTRSVAVQARVADRQLTALGEGASGPMALPAGAEPKSLEAWVLARLGMPEDYPGRWKDVSERALEIFEWLLIKDELLKILEMFAREAQQSDRGRFWRAEVHRIRDARFVRNEEMAICMIVVGEHLVIEFGQTANAAYIYGVPGSAPRLRRLSGLPHRAAGFKQRDAVLRLGTVEFEYVTRILHHDGWESRARDWLNAPRRVDGYGIY